MIANVVAENTNKAILTSMAAAGLHFGALRSRRHPSTKQWVFGVKDNHEIVDLGKTIESLERAKEFIRKLSSEGKKLLLVGNKNEARETIKRAGEYWKLPYVVMRWIGGTLTNFDEIKKRIERLKTLEEESASGELSKYTKKERAKLTHELKDLKRYFSGIVDMADLPAALLVIDAGKEEIAVTEARKMGLPVISLSCTDCDVSRIDYPIVGNDKSAASIKFIVDELVSCYKK